MTLDAKAMLDLSVTGALDTKLTPIPVGEYPCMIEEVDVKPWQGKEDPTKSGLKLLLKLEVQDPAVKSFLNRDKVTIGYDIMLDLTPEGGLDMGKAKNVRLGALREAIGLNSPTEPFSFRMLPGKHLKAAIGQEPGYKDPTSLVAFVKAVTKL